MYETMWVFCQRCSVDLISVGHVFWSFTLPKCLTKQTVNSRFCTLLSDAVWQLRPQVAQSLQGRHGSLCQKHLYHEDCIHVLFFSGPNYKSLKTFMPLHFAFYKNSEMKVDKGLLELTSSFSIRYWDCPLHLLFCHSCRHSQGASNQWWPKLAPPPIDSM